MLNWPRFPLVIRSSILQKSMKHFGFFRMLYLNFTYLLLTVWFAATGTIDGKFDCGYLVSVKVGSEILNGVLYYPDQAASSIATNQSCTTLIPFNPKPLNSGRRNRRRRRRGGDPSRPKPNRSGYNFFFAEKHSALKSMYPDREREFTKMIGESWTNLGQEERMVSEEVCIFWFFHMTWYIVIGFAMSNLWNRIHELVQENQTFESWLLMGGYFAWQVYQSIGLKDKERYQRELKEYKERTNPRQQKELL